MERVSKMKQIILPGLIDPHVHFRTPGQEYKEDFTTGTSAAVAGGYTMVLDMPNNKVPITTEKVLMEKIEIARKNVICDIGFHFGSLGDNLDEFKKVHDKVTGLKLYLNETTGNFLIDEKTLAKIFKSWPKNSGPILVHAEDDAVVAVLREAKENDQTVHFCHISLRTDLEQIIAAKKDGVKVSCGVTPHHLFLTQIDAEKLGGFGKMKPYLKSKEDVDFLWENISEIDVVESDHAPHTKEEKESIDPPFGVPGLETTLPLLLTAVSEKKLTIEDVIRLTHDNPKRIFNLPDQDAKIYVNIGEEYKISNSDLQIKVKWSPFAGRKLTGRVVKVILRGEVIFENGQVLASRGFGKIIKNF